MYGTKDEDHNVMYYLTVYNEPIHQPAEPANVDVEGIVKGIHKISESPLTSGPKAQLLASGVAVPWAEELSSCWLRTGASPQTSGLSPRGPSCAATALPLRKRLC